MDWLSGGARALRTSSTYDTAVTRPNRSFAPNSSETVALATGQIAHRDHVAQNDVIARCFYEVTAGVWCLVGNGLSNQTFIEGPDGIIAIDTGESTEEMREAIAELRTVTDRPIVAVLYTHFHYVGGTEAVFEDGAPRDIPIWAHEKVAFNRNRAATEIAPAYGRGLAEQFAMLLPDDGPDGRVNIGLGFFFRNPAHAPFTSVFVPPTHTFGASARIEVAGLPIEVTHAPSDADDSVTYWFPTLGVAVNNLVWPVLFNVFAIRGEEYRDPQVLLAGIDHLLSLGADHLVATHGPPILGRETIDDRVTRYRDSIQFLWDQTVRLTNRGLLSADLGLAVQLPPEADADNLTAERYGVAEHHFRQIRSGLFGWFDGDESQLFPLPSGERARRLVEGFGGAEAVREQAGRALDDDDLRWGIELASWLVRSGDEPVDRALLARGLRTVAQRTPAANIRSWCLTRVLALEGAIDTSRLYRHRFSKAQVIGSKPDHGVPILRVLVDPELASGIDLALAWDFGQGIVTGLHLRNSIAFVNDGARADAVISCSPVVWADLLTNRAALSQVLADGSLVVTGEVDAAVAALGVFEVDGLRA
jgi:alkyl sulfatase BDS1-like metallo-beta-lactamase superfamily hydrolase